MKKNLKWKIDMKFFLRGNELRFFFGDKLLGDVY